MYTLEIAGKPTAITKATDEDEAEAIFRSNWFKADLMTFETEGQPLWDEDESKLFIRRAFPEEEAVWERNFAKALREGDAEPGEDYLVFLVPVTDTTDELD